MLIFAWLCFMAYVAAILSLGVFLPINFLLILHNLECYSHMFYVNCGSSGGKSLVLGNYAITDGHSFYILFIQHPKYVMLYKQLCNSLPLFMKWLILGLADQSKRVYQLRTNCRNFKSENGDRSANILILFSQGFYSEYYLLSTQI